MVAIAQSVEHLIVVQKVARSSRVSHPMKTADQSAVFLFMRLTCALFSVVEGFMML